jgi:hypothetical protein
LDEGDCAERGIVDRPVDFPPNTFVFFLINHPDARALDLVAGILSPY